MLWLGISGVFQSSSLARLVSVSIQMQMRDGLRYDLITSS